MNARSPRALLSPEEAAGLFAPLDAAVGLPGRVYVEKEYWDVEREKLFRQDWFAIGFASDVPRVGDITPITIAGFEFLLVRDSDAQVRVFHNVCRHRGTKLVLKTANVQAIRCGWHCWTYSLSGALLATPIIAGPRTREHERFRKSELGLIPVRSEIWNGAVFVNVSGDARPFEALTGNLDRLFAKYKTQDFDFEAPVRHEDRSVHINWKLYHEGGLEGYHLPFVHPALEQPERYDVHDDPDSYTSLTGFLSRYKRLGLLAGVAEEVLDLNAAASEAQKSGSRIPYTICFVTPTLVFAVWPEAVVATLLRPVSPNETGVRRNLYFIGTKATAPEAAPAREKYLAIWEDITAEDADYSQGVQRLSLQRDEIGVGTRFSPYWEEAVNLFQRRIATKAYGVAPVSPSSSLPAASPW